MKKVSLLFVIFLTLSFLASCSGGSKNSKPSGEIVGKVGNEYVTWKEFKQQLDSLPQYYRQFLERGNAKEGFLQKQLIKKAMVLEAEARGYGKDPKILSQLKRMKEQLLIRKLMEADRKKHITVTDDEIKSYYDQHKNEFKVEDEVKVRQIMVKLPPNATPQQQKKALIKIKKILRELKAGKKFEDLVAKYSEDNTTKMSKGELPFFSRNRRLRNYMDKNFMDAAFSLNKKGDISGIVKTAYGYHIIQLIDKHPARQKDFIEVAPQIKRTLEQRKRINQRKQMEENLIKKYNIVVYKKVLDKVSGSVSRKPPIRVRPTAPRPNMQQQRVQVPVKVRPQQKKQVPPNKHNEPR